MSLTAGLVVTLASLFWVTVLFDHAEHSDAYSQPAVPRRVVDSILILYVAVLALLFLSAGLISVLAFLVAMVGGTLLLFFAFATAAILDEAAPAFRLYS